jgi:hypothetical protein
MHPFVTRQAAGRDLLMTCQKQGFTLYCTAIEILNSEPPMTQVAHSLKQLIKQTPLAIFVAAVRS